MVFREFSPRVITCRLNQKIDKVHLREVGHRAAAVGTVMSASSQGADSASRSGSAVKQRFRGETQCFFSSAFDVTVIRSPLHLFFTETKPSDGSRFGIHARLLLYISTVHVARTSEAKHQRKEEKV